jgi:hypothetical protein
MDTIRLCDGKTDERTGGIQVNILAGRCFLFKQFALECIPVLSGKRL